MPPCRFALREGPQPRGASPSARAAGLVLLLAAACSPPGTSERRGASRLAEAFSTSFDEAFTADDQGRLTATAGSGWRSLLDEALEDWEVVGSPSGATLADGVLAFRGLGGDGQLRTREDYRDFALRLDFKVASMANSGVFLRGARAGGDPAYSGCEIQILDDFNWERNTGTTLKPYQLTGGLYGCVAAGEKTYHPLGEWNTFEIVYLGTWLRVDLNGRTLYEVDTFRVPADPPFSERAPAGFIGLQRHAPARVGDAEYAWFRNVFVRPM